MNEKLKIKPNALLRYISMAPLALAFERVVEYRILKEQEFERPVLDIGCGEGVFTNILFSSKIDLGIDPNPKELKRAHDLGGYKELIECFGDKIPKPDGAYRTIFSNSVIEHIVDIKPVLAEAYRLLAPGGRLYLTVPSNRFDEYTFISQILLFFGLKNWQKRFSFFFNRFWAHYHYYDPEQWSKLVSEPGFEVVELRGYCPKRVCMMNDFLVPFSILEYLTKKFFNRWTLVPSLRKIILSPIALLGNLFLQGAEKSKDGGLVFISLQKPN